MKKLISKLEKEITGLREQMPNELKVQQDQLQSMMAASMKQAEREREAFIKENRAWEERLLELLKSNEANMLELMAKYEEEKLEPRSKMTALLKDEMEASVKKLVKNMLELMFGKHGEEKLELRFKMKAPPKDEMEASLEKLNERHTEEVTALLEKMDIQIDGKREAVEKPSYMKQGFKAVAQVAPLVGKALAVYPPAKPYAEPFAVAVVEAVEAVAGALSECDCSIM